MKIEFNQAYYGIDCLNKEIGLPYLYRQIKKKKLQRFDLLLTDPFYNIEAKEVKGKGDGKDLQREVEIYMDYMPPKRYFIFNNIWFYYGKKIAKRMIFTCGKSNLYEWLKILESHYKRPLREVYLDDQIRRKFDILIWEIPNSSSRGFISKFIKQEPMIAFGNFKRHKLLFDLIKAYVNSGFLISKNIRGKSKKREMNIKHPHPKPEALYEKILTQLKPGSVLDPFLGSGTTAKVCKKLNINYLGYDINEIYEQDYLTKINAQERQLKRQIDLDKFMNKQDK